MRAIARTIVVTGVLAGACAGGLATLPAGPRPAWVGAKDATGYPPSEYFTGIGMVLVQKGNLEATQQAADAAARVDLVAKLEVTVSSEMTSYQAERQRGADTTSTQSTEELTKQTIRDFDLEGVEVKERWLDASNGVAYAIAVWPKVRAEALLRAKITELGAAADKARAEADRVAGTSPGAALRQYLAAAIALDRAARAGVFLRVVTGRAGALPDPAPVATKVHELLAAMDVQAAAGDGQRAKPNEALPQPLVVAATLRGAPLAGLPMRFELPGGQVTEAVDTDPQGFAQARVTSAGALASEARAVARVDWARLAGVPAATGLLATLRPFEVGFAIVPKSLASTRVIVKIFEKNENAVEDASTLVQTAVSNAFTTAGFSVRDAEALVARVPAADLLALDPKELQKRARDVADVAVVGQAVSAHSSTLSGDVVVHRARVQMRVVDLGTGQVITMVELEKKGTPQVGPSKAGRKALEALASAVGPDVAAQVKQKLGM